MIRVLNAGFFTTIQDKGRVGFAKFGIPISGVMDSYSADLANHILNNSLDTALLEITFGGCSLQFIKNTMICISGADFSPTVNQMKIPLNTRIFVHNNDVLSFGTRHFGAFCYLAVKGGFLTEIKFNSRSFFQNITDDFMIRKENLLPFLEFHDFKSSHASVKTKKSYFKKTKIKCFKGPEFDLLTKNQQNLLLKNKFAISKDMNRTGFHLVEILENNLSQILTSAVLPGTVQLTPSGKLIVLMRDCQVTGGYPRILQLTEKSINIFSQKIAGDTFVFSILKL